VTLQTGQVVCGSKVHVLVAKDRDKEERGERLAAVVYVCCFAVSFYLDYSVNANVSAESA
jgi:hypothetical protein